MGRHTRLRSFPASPFSIASPQLNRPTMFGIRSLTLLALSFVVWTTYGVSTAPAPQQDPWASLSHAVENIGIIKGNL